MNVLIYQSLIIYIFVLIYGVHTNNVVVEGSKGGLLGENGTEIKCLYTQEDIVSVSFMAFNKSSITVESIATYRPNKTPTLDPKGQYLKGRVTLMNITQSSTKAVMTFDKLMCIDDTFYKCKVNYFDSSNLLTDIISNNGLNISVQVQPSKPDSVSLVYTSADSPVTTTKDMDYSTSLPSNKVTLNVNNTVSALKMENQTTTTDHSTIQTTDLNITTSTLSSVNVSSNISYETTTYYKQQTTTEQVLDEGDNITVVCTGDVGNPPVEHFFQKILDGHTTPVNYTASATSISEMSENCSYYRTSNITFQVKAEDNNAVIRCVVNSPMASTDMYKETKRIEVYYEVSMPTITKYPNDSYYIVDEATSINLTCKSDGNPKPNYRWYKENDNEPVSISANWTITDINVTNSGVYTCNVSNTFNGKTHRNAKHVHINIMNKDDVPTTQSSSTCSSSCVEKKEVKSKGNLDDIQTTQSSSNCRSACVDKKEENSTEKLVLVAGIVGAVVAVLVVVIVIIACTCRRRKNKSPTFTNVSNSFDDSKPKSVTVPRTGDYDSIALDDNPPKAKSSNNGLEAEDINKHNEEYLKKQEEEKKKNESNTPPQPAVYAQVNEASKLKNKQKTETPEKSDKQEEDPYAETQDDVYDEAGKPCYKEKKNAEQFDVSTNSSKHKSNDDNKLSIHTSQVGSYVNQVFEKDENRKIATVSPTVRSSSGSQNDEQTNSNRNSQSKKEYENIIGTDQTGILEEESSHRTAL